MSTYLKVGLIILAINAVLFGQGYVVDQSYRQVNNSVSKSVAYNFPLVMTEYPLVTNYPFLLPRNGYHDYAHVYVDLPVTLDRVETLVSGGRCRWKAENECFNVLKNHGYCLEHSYGHGENNLCFKFYLMTLLGFFIYQIFELTDDVYKTARKKFGSKNHMSETLRSYIKIIVFDTCETLLAFGLTPTSYL